MKRFKKFISLFLTMVMLLSICSIGITVSATDTGTNTTEETPLKIEIETDTKNPSVYSVVGFTVKITNTGDEDLTNVTAQTVFDDLSPVNNRKSETTKEVETLKAGESFSYSYRATLNMNNPDLHFFNRFILWFVRLFSGGYTVENTNIDDGRTVVENITEFSFGGVVAKNNVNVLYYIDSNDDVDLPSNIISFENKESELNNIEDINGDIMPEITYSEYGVPDWIFGNYYSKKVYNENDAINSLYSIKNLLGFNSIDEFKCSYSGNVLDKTIVYRLQQYYKDYEVYGASLVLDVDKTSKNITSMSGDYIPSSYFDTTCNISFEQAKNIVVNDLKNNELIDTNSKMIFMHIDDSDLNYYLAYEIAVNNIDVGPQIYNISAINGEVLNINSLINYDKVEASGIDNQGVKRNFYCEKISEELYYLADFDKNIAIYDAGNKNIYAKYNITSDGKWIFDVYWQNGDLYTWDSWFTTAKVVQNDKNKWTDRKSVTLMANISEVYDYYLKELKLKGFDNKNSYVYAIINDNIGTDGTPNRTNAYSIAKKGVETAIISFGVDNEIEFDTVAHEYTHSVMNSILEIGSSGETGALKEAYADIMGEIIERDTSWTHGKRVISNPTSAKLPDYYKGAYWGDTNPKADDKGHIHNNSTVISHAAYLMYNKGMCFADLAQIWYYSMNYLEKDSDFKDCRDAVLKSAKKLEYPEVIINFIEQSFDEAGIFDIKKNISGTVIDKDTEKPISNAYIFAKYTDVEGYMAKTNEKGEFEITLPKGLCEFEIHHENYEIQYHSWHIDEDTKINISLNPLKTISGIVTDKLTELPIFDITIYVYSVDEPNRPLIVVSTDENGYYSFTLPKGEYTIEYLDHSDVYNFLEDNLNISNSDLKKDVALTPQGENADGGNDDGNDDDRTIIDSGDCGADGDNVKWTLYDDGELVISGGGKMKDYYNRGAFPHTPWISYRDIITSVIFSYGITNIGGSALDRCQNLTSVLISESVKSIDICAFNLCKNITSITIPKSVTSIREYAFSDCINLENVYFNGDLSDWCTVNTIGNPYLLHYADNFYVNDELISGDIKIPDGVNKICNYAFWGCDKITSISIPNSVTNIGDGAFGGCTGITSITIPNSVKGIGDNAFYACNSFTEITIPDSVTDIGSYAFGNCSNLTSAELPSGIKSIDAGTFSNCSNLSNIVIPENVTSIGNNAFYGCTNLKKINIPKSVTRIGSKAFYYCKNLKSILLPDSLEDIGDSAFYGCSSLTEISIPDNVEYIFSDTFKGCSNLYNLIIGNGVKSIGARAFEGCKKLTNITIGNSISSIYDEAYWAAFIYCPNITNVYYNGDIAGWCNNYAASYLMSKFAENSYINGKPISGDVIIPDGVTNIPDYIFKNCTEITSITIPGSVKNIGIGVVNGCTSIEDIYFTGDIKDWCEIETSGHLCSANYYIGGELVENLVIPNGISQIRNGAFYGCLSLKSVTIPDSVTTIGHSAFENCTNLVRITIPDTVTSIYREAFYHTGYYNNIENWDNNVLYIDNHLIEAKAPFSGDYSIKDGTKTIGEYAFYNRGLTTISIPNSVITIGESAFDSCCLTSVKIPDSVITIGDCAFENCTNLTDITVDIDNKYYSSDMYGVLFNKEKTKLIQYPAGNLRTTYTIPDNVISIDIAAFSECFNLKEIIISNGVTTIGVCAFSDCNNLKEIIIPKSVTSIGQSAFSDCNNLKDVYYEGSKKDWDNINKHYFGNVILEFTTIHYNS